MAEKKKTQFPFCYLVKKSEFREYIKSIYSVFRLNRYVYVTVDKLLRF